MDDIQPASSFHTHADRNKTSTDEKTTLLIDAIDEVFERRHKKLCENLGRVYAVSAMVFLLVAMVLIIAGFTLKDFFGLYVLLPIGLVFGIGAIFKYAAAKNFFDQ